ncbi:MAG TPA: thiolase family protein [Polyangiaceae bacterium LLY-WYZ-15_(1-7)]|nr:acetyl-CoA C-acyltransferase [Myxococcales bacterium]MAT23973.1 acetyl-CoA C-acyltransferase [Sandaracinus sp.]HJK94384.1 thiolase family protein [Polyangiaceae bacterium LLY-WYZ-15_(1-7)]MBJ71630.1 acetyl-CoA C-acyltransferase [Sandaracinus sp.]HJL05594.1 thiolase family protein [Polyangiaceae bacterium LLY-WYZ-15_(1-7)]
MKKLSKELWIVAAKRTPFGTMNGTLKGISAIDLGVHASKAALEQSTLKADEIDHVILGNVQQTSPDAIYGARHVGLKAGLPIETPALTVNRLCGSGFQAVVNAAEQILLGDAKAVLAVGAENMSQAPHSVWGLRDGQKFGRPPKMVDTLWEALTDSYCNTPMAVTAENLAEKYGITREDADAFGLRSQKKWAAAQEGGFFADEIAPVEVKTRKGTKTLDKDEHARPETTMEILAKLPPVFKKDGVVTAGNASGICDGAAALVVVDGEWAKGRGLTPLAKILQWGVAGVDPTIMGIGPAPAIRSALDRAGIGIGDVDLFDVNEAFAPQFLAVQKELELPEEKVNPNGGAIALGHPLGATGARITTNLVYTARKMGKSISVGSACIGGGQGIAIVLETA